MFFSFQTFYLLCPDCILNTKHTAASHSLSVGNIPLADILGKVYSSFG